MKTLPLSGSCPGVVADSGRLAAARRRGVPTRSAVDTTTGDCKPCIVEVAGAALVHAACANYRQCLDRAAGGRKAR